jgi:hypothetical protein
MIGPDQDGITVMDQDLNLATGGDLIDEDAVACLEAYGNAVRMVIYGSPVRSGPDGLRPGRITAPKGLAGSMLSRHLRTFTQARLIRRWRPGTSQSCAAARGLMQGLVHHFAAGCCADSGPAR